MRASSPAIPDSAGPGLRERKKARQRGQILDTALRLFRRRGYDDTTVEQIVGELEISPATFYNYFPSKDAVLADFGRIALERARDLLREEHGSPADTVLRLQAFLRRIAEAVESDKGIWRVIFATGALNRTDEGEKRAASVASSALLEQILADGQQRGQVTRSLPPPLLAQLLQGAILKLCADYSFDFPTRHRLAQRLETALALFVVGPQADPPDADESARAQQKEPPR